MNPSVRWVVLPRLGLVLTLLVLASLVLATSACSGWQTRRTALRDAVTSYATAVRWGHVQKAARYIPDKQRADFIARKREAYRHLRVHEVEVRSVNLNDDQSRARVLLAMAFSVGGNPIIKRHMVEQQWRHGDFGWVVVKRRRVKAKKSKSSTPGDLY